MVSGSPMVTAHIHASNITVVAQKRLLLRIIPGKTVIAVPVDMDAIIPAEAQPV